MLKYCVLLAFSSQLLGFEFFKTQDGTLCKWDYLHVPGKTIHWKVSDGAPEIARESMRFVTQAWTEASAGVLQFSEGDGGIEVAWGDAGQAVTVTALAQTILSVDGSTIVGAKIIVNTSNYNWTRGPVTAPRVTVLRSFDLDPVLLHEMGHALGLDHSNKNAAETTDHSDLPTMNSIIFSCCKSLHIDDISGIRTLYGIEVPLPQLALEASPARGPAPLTVALIQSGGNDETRWDFGDGTNITGTAASHRFRAPGHYEVSASVNGMKTTVTIEVTKKVRKKRAPLKRN